MALALPAHANTVSVPPVPFNIAVGDGFIPFLVGHAEGTQNYVCLPTSTGGVAYTLFTPEAVLANDDGKQLITHFFSPNPYEPNTNPALFAVGPIRATWQHSRDTSAVWGLVKPPSPENPLGDASTDQKFVAKNAIAWLKVTATGSQNGPEGGDILTNTKFIQRLNTAGGVAPSTGCSTLAELGHLAFVPYTADYFFYRSAD
ncbi:MAG: DUF3455 domain-containing protein [Myxococcales bacterium]